jgi:hypothetical protein
MAIQFHHDDNYVRQLMRKLSDTGRQNPWPNHWHDLSDMLGELLLYRDWLNKQINENLPTTLQ